MLNLTLELGCGVSMTWTESPSPAAASQSSTSAEATGNRRLWDHQVESEVENDREEDGDEELRQEASRGVEKWLRPGWMEAVEMTAGAPPSPSSWTRRSGPTSLPSTARPRSRRWSS